MEGGRDPFGSLRDSRGRIERCRTLKAPSSRATLGGRCGGRPPTASGPGRRDSGPSGHETLDGRLELWWCTPTTSGSRASRGRCRRQRRSRSACEQRALRAVCRVTEDRAGSAATPPPPKVAGRQQPPVEASRQKSASGPSDGAGGRPRVSWSRDEVRGVRVAEDRAGSASRAPPQQAARREQPAGRSSSLDGGLRTARRQGGTTHGRFDARRRARSCVAADRAGSAAIADLLHGVTRRWQPAGRSFSFESGLRAARRRAGTTGG